LSRRDDPSAEARRRLLRRAALYSHGLIIAAIVIALAGAALIAFLLRGTGYPFLGIWLVVSAIVLVPPLIMYVLRSIRQ
jgi:hypothetical protein